MTGPEVCLRIDQLSFVKGMIAACLCAPCWHTAVQAPGLHRHIVCAAALLGRPNQTSIPSR